MKSIQLLSLLSLTLLLPPCTARALTLKAAGSTGVYVAVQSSRNASALQVTPFHGGIAMINTSATGTAFLLKNGQAFGPIVFGYKQGNKVYSYAQARKAGICKKNSARAIMAVKAGKMGKKTITMTIKDSLGVGYLSAPPPKAAVDSSSLAKIDASCVPIGAHHRLGMATATSRSRVRALASGAAACQGSSNDKDHDGIPDNFDADNDNNGTVDNDDAQCNDIPQGLSGSDTSFWMFSNFHLDFDKSINASMSGITLSKDVIDTRLSEYNGLAIQVAGGGQLPVELDCGTLNYCSQGGTGTVADGPPTPDGANNRPFPGQAGGSYDTDGDGLGSITAGSTGDFQLKTNATSDQIRSGDVLLQHVSQSDGSVKTYAGMLNYLFWTTPALKSLTAQGGQTYEISYPVAQNAHGTQGNCFHVPGSGDVVLTMTLWRPQRKGISDAGEATLMDMGNLRLQANMPNAPTAPQPPSPGSENPAPARGPGTCIGNERTFPSIDSNFIRVGDGIQDRKGDAPSNASNTFTYSINISECLKSENNFNQQTITWGSGQSLMLPLQMTNQYGDTAVQNICLVRD